MVTCRNSFFAVLEDADHSNGCRCGPFRNMQDRAWREGNGPDAAFHHAASLRPSGGKPACGQVYRRRRCAGQPLGPA
jgi:hypothetical protein